MCACCPALSVASFVWKISPEPMRFQRKLRAEPEGFFMYFHPFKVPEFFSVAFQRKWTRKLVRRVDKLMVHMHHEFVPRR